MMKRISAIALTLLMGAGSVFAQGFWGRGPVEDPTGYKDTYKDYFTVGSYRHKRKANSDTTRTVVPPSARKERL